MDGARLVDERRMGRAPVLGVLTVALDPASRAWRFAAKKSLDVRRTGTPSGAIGHPGVRSAGTIAAAPAAPYICL